MMTNWVKTSFLEVTQNEVWFDDDDRVIPRWEDLPHVTLTFQKPGARSKPVTSALTHMTVDELTAFRRIVNEAIETAMPICAELDERAHAEFEEDPLASFDYRIYRQDPIDVGRPRSQPADDTGLPIRLDGVVGERRKLPTKRARGRDVQVPGHDERPGESWIDRAIDGETTSGSDPSMGES